MIIPLEVRKRLSYCARTSCTVQNQNLATRFRTARVAAPSTDTESRCALQTARLISTRNRRVSTAFLRTSSPRRRRTFSNATPKRTSCAFVTKKTAIHGWPGRGSGCIASIATSAIYLPARGSTRHMCPSATRCAQPIDIRHITCVSCGVVLIYFSRRRSIS